MKPLHSLTTEFQSRITQIFFAANCQCPRSLWQNHSSCAVEFFGNHSAYIRRCDCHSCSWSGMYHYYVETRKQSYWGSSPTPKCKPCRSTVKPCPTPNA